MTDLTPARLGSSRGEVDASPCDGFAFKLFGELTRGHENANVIFSPLSVMLGLLALWEGASGETREAMSRVLEIANEDVETAERPLRGVRQLLTSALAVPGLGPKMAIASSLWCSDQLTVHSRFLAEVKRKYAAEVFSVPMADPHSVARINAYVAEKTAGKIVQLLESLDPLLLLLVVNAIYFKGLWQKPFDRRLTRLKRFNIARRDTIEAPFMHQHGEYSYYEERSFQAVRLPYQGRRVGMYVFLPAKVSGLPDLLHSVTPAFWDRWLGSLRHREGTVALPRFKVEYGVGLGPTLVDLGMGEAFRAGKAQFDHIATPPPPLWLGGVIHRAVVEVNEEGTEAAAFTRFPVLGDARMRPPVRRPFAIIVDRPFFVAIRDDRSRAILFMGAVNRPA